MRRGQNDVFDVHPGVVTHRNAPHVLDVIFDFFRIVVRLPSDLSRRSGE